MGEAVRGADVVGPDREAPGRGRQADVEPALGVAVAADELARADVVEAEVAVADRAGAEDQLLHGPAHDVAPDLVAVGLELVEGPVEHGPRLVHDLVPAPLPGLDLLHVRVDRGRHLGPRDRGRVVLEGLDHGAAHEGRAEGGALDVLPADELADHLVPGRLGPEAELLHLLDQARLGVPRRGLGLLLLELDGLDGEALADLEGRELVLGRGRVRVDHAPAGLGEGRAGGRVRLARRPRRGPSAWSSGRRGRGSRGSGARRARTGASAPRRARPGSLRRPGRSAGGRSRTSCRGSGSGGGWRGPRRRRP